MNNTIFWNVDTQKDFMLPGGKLYIKGAEEIIPNLKKLTEFAKQNNIKVVNTADYHTISSIELSETPDFKTTFPNHCMAGEGGQDFIDETYPKCLHDNYYIIRWTDLNINEPNFKKSRNIVILKDAFNVFAGNKLADLALKLINPEKIVVYGVAGDYCVDFAIRGLIARGYEVIAVLDAIKSIGAIPLKEWTDLGVILVSTEVLFTWF